MTYGNGDTVSYTYDTLGRRTSMTTADGNKYLYTYTGDGQLYEITDTDAEVVYRYQYDSIGRLIGSEELRKQTGDDGTPAAATMRLQTWHQYDSNDRLTVQSWKYLDKAYTERYNYDTSGRLASKTFTLPNGQVSTITPAYDSLSRVQSVSTPKYTANYTYLAGSGSNTTTALVSGMEYAKVGTSGDFAPISFGYTYNAMGNITSASQTGEETVYYGYDAQGQLTRVTDDNGYWIYTYDTYGNVREQVYYDNFNALQEIHEYQYSTGNWKDQLTFLEISTRENQSGVSGSFTYDASGNPLTYFNGNNWTLTWKNGRQLATATKTGTSVSYGYDLNGLRTSKKVGGVTHTYLYAGGQLLRETYISGRITRKLDFLYDQNGRPYALNDTNGTTTSLYYYVLNLQGDVIQLVGTDGNIAASYRYDPWGRVISATGSMANINPLRYRGYYYDTETGFYYLQSRYYDPTVCRFINADSYASTDTGFIGNNMFAYCNNNPISRDDEDGELGLSVLLGGVVGAAMDYGLQVFDNFCNGKTGLEAFSDVNWGSVAGSAFSGALSAIPGLGTVAAAAWNAVGSAVIEEVVNSIIGKCNGTYSWSWSNLAENTLFNAASEIISLRAPTQRMPQYIRDIKAEAVEKGIKGTRKLTRYLIRKQYVTAAKNAFWGSVYPGTIKRGIKCLSITCY